MVGGESRARADPAQLPHRSPEWPATLPWQLSQASGAAACRAWASFGGREGYANWRQNTRPSATAVTVVMFPTRLCQLPRVRPGLFFLACAQQAKQRAASRMCSLEGVGQGFVIPGM